MGFNVPDENDGTTSLSVSRSVASELAIGMRQVQRYWAGDSHIRAGSPLARLIEELVDAASVKQSRKK